MAGTETNTEYDEFIVDTSKLTLVNEIQNKVERLFSINLYVDESTDNKGEKSWLRVDGQKCDRKDAREYILAVCHPESKQKLQIKDTGKDAFDEETLEDIEAKTCAQITLQDNMLEISGSELAVILAMTTLESKGAVSVDDTEPDGESDEPTKKSEAPVAKNRWTSKMDSQLEKLLCKPGNNNESISIMDYTKSSPSIKMTILKCMTDLDDISDSDLFPSSRDEAPPMAPSHKLVICGDSDEEKMDSDCTDGKTVKQLTDKLTTAQISPSPGRDTSQKPGKDTIRTANESDIGYFRKFGNSVGYSEQEIEEGLLFCDDKTTPADFLKILNDLKEKKRELQKKNSSDEVSTDVGSETNFPPPPNEPSPSSSSVNGRRSLPKECKKKLVEDFVEETADLSVDELKKRNAERQRLLKSAFENSSSNVPESKSPLKKKRRKKKRKKSAEAKKFIGDGSKENPAILCSSDDDKEQTKVMTIWNDDDSEASDSDDCMIVDETFPKATLKKGKIVSDSIISSNQPNTEQKTVRKRASRFDQPPRASRFDQPPNNCSANFPDTDNNKPTDEQWTIVQNKKQQQLQNIQHNQLPGSLQNQYLHAEGGIPPFNGPPPLIGLDSENQIPPPVPSLGPAPAVQPKNLRYVVIDGSNVAMCHGCNKKFSCRGIKIVIDYFLQRGHTQITAFVPEWRRYNPRPENPIIDQPLLNELKEDGHLVFTPSRRINNRLIAAYDDRFVLELAEREEGIIVSNDQYRDLMQEKYSWRKIIEERLLLFSFVGDNFMPPFDPLGRYGPNLDEFLCKPQIRKRGMNQSNSQYYQRDPQYNAWRPGQRQQENISWRHQGPLQQGVVRPYERNPNPYGWSRPQVAPQRLYNNNNQGAPQQQAAQGKGAGAGGGGGKSPQKSLKAGPARSPAKTREIEDKLKAIFPQNGGKISEILQNHPSETDVEKLTNYLMNAIFSL